MAEDLRLVPPERRHGLACRPCGSHESATRIDPGTRSTPAHVQAIRLRPATDQDRPERAALLRRARCRLLPGTASWTSGSGWTAREHPILEARIEQIDPDLTFKVGLIYGPSGCGKSSLVKAGLLPRLGKHVLPVYIEATPEETEARLLKGLRKVCPELPRGWGWSIRWRNLRRGRVFAGQQSAAGPGPVRAVAPCEARRGEHRAGRRAPPVRWRACPGGRDGAG